MRSLHAAVLSVALAAMLLPAAGVAGPPRGETGRSPVYPWRVIESAGNFEDDDVAAHLSFSLGHGFNGIWVAGDQAGQWNETPTSKDPVVDPAFADWAHRLAVRGVRVFVVINPVRDSGGAYGFRDRDGVRRIRRFIRMLRREAAVQDFVVSFRDAPLRLEELREVLEFGANSGPAHLDLIRRLQRRLSRRERLWFEPAIASTAGISDASIPYATALLEGLSDLDLRTGLVWNGPRPASPVIEAADVDRLEAFVGKRPVILRDRFPAGLGEERLALAVSLAALEGRDPALRYRLAAYVVQPANELAASRLALRTVGEYLRNPIRYDPAASWRGAIVAMAGSDRPAAHEALTTQAMEWGGWIGSRNYRSPLGENPTSAASILDDPAAVASWTWVERRYPQRMQYLATLTDERFRSDLLAVMASRLAVARALPTVRELIARLSAGRSDTALPLQQLRRLRSSLAGDTRATIALDRFFVATGVADLVRPPVRQPSGTSPPAKETGPAGSAW